MLFPRGLILILLEWIRPRQVLANMNDSAIISYLLGLHIACGMVALATFSIPLFAKKGGKLHTRSGWIYSVAMATVSFTSFVMTPWRFFFDPSRTEDSQRSAVFLFYIALLALAALQQGLFVLKRKVRSTSLLTVKTLGLPVSLELVSVGILLLGLTTQNWRFVIFAIIGGRSAYRQISFWTRPQAHSKGWFFFHLENMFACCIATVTAFAVTAVPRIWPQFNSIYVWLAPTVVMVPWLIWYVRSYEEKFRLQSSTVRGGLAI